MNSRSITLRLGEFLIRCAVRRLPPKDRKDWYRTFTAELPVFLDHPDVRPAFRRHAQALRYAADSIRGAWLLRSELPGAAPTMAGAAVSTAVSISVSATALLVAGALFMDIHLILVLSGYMFGMHLLVSGVLFARAAAARTRRPSSGDDAPLGGA